MFRRRTLAVVAGSLAFDAVALAILAILGVVPFELLAVAFVLALVGVRMWQAAALARIDGDGVWLARHGSWRWPEIRELAFRKGALVVRPHGALQAPAVSLDGARMDAEAVTALAAANGVRTADEPAD